MPLGPHGDTLRVRRQIAGKEIGPVLWTGHAWPKLPTKDVRGFQAVMLVSSDDQIEIADPPACRGGRRIQGKIDKGCPTPADRIGMAVKGPMKQHVSRSSSKTAAIACFVARPTNHERRISSRMMVPLELAPRFADRNLIAGMNERQG